jgi:isoquinoline 1-oxidoreductase beta subunit
MWPLPSGTDHVRPRAAGQESQADRRRYRGITVHESFGSVVAEVAAVSVAAGGAVRVRRVVCAVDCGILANPDTVVAQTESGSVFGLTAALYGETTLDNGRVQQSNFRNYPLLRMTEMPVIDAHILPSTEAPGGVGGPSVLPIAPAVTNAIFAATGRHIRSLPVSQHALGKA